MNSKYQSARERIMALCQPENRLALEQAFALSAQEFSEPSRHYHHRALKHAWSGDLNEASEALYAMLVAWGMNRTGSTGPKMKRIDRLRESLSVLRPMLAGLRNKKPQHLESQDWQALETVFKTLDVMQTDSILVAHSKLLAHLLPQLVGPIDRSYTCFFLFKKLNLPQRIDRQWDWFKEIHIDFYHPLLENPSVKACIDRYIDPDNTESWHTSPLKILDNLVLAHLKTSSSLASPAQ